MYSIHLAKPVTSRDRIKITRDRGVTLSVQEWGNPKGQPCDRMRKSFVTDWRVSTISI